MPEVDLRIAGKAHSVACAPGQEPQLRAAAELVDAEAATVAAQLGRLPEARAMLLVALMLADRVIEAEARSARAETEADTLRRRPDPPPRRVEVPVIPPQLAQSLADLAARAEALAGQAEEQMPG